MVWSAHWQMQLVWTSPVQPALCTVQLMHVMLTATGGESDLFLHSLCLFMSINVCLCIG